MKKAVFLILLGLAMGPKVKAQTSEDYFQWFNAIGGNAAPHLQFAGVKESELQAASVILVKFKAEEFGLEASYNNLPSTVAGNSTGADEFLSRQAALVERTLGKLLTVLSSDSLTRVQKHIQQEALRNQKINAKMSAHRSQSLVNIVYHPHLHAGMNFYNVHYNFYTTYSLTPTGDGSGNANLVIISQITGYTSCPSGCPGPIHQARVVDTLGPDVHGPQLSPVSYMNVSNDQAQFESFAAPTTPVSVGVGGEVDCTQVGDIAPFGVTYTDFSIEPAILRLSRNPSNGATTVYATDRSKPCDYTGPAVVPSTWQDKHNNNDGPQGFEDWEALGLSADGAAWIFPSGTGASSGKNVYGTYPPVLPDCTNSKAGIFPPIFPF